MVWHFWSEPPTPNQAILPTSPKWCKVSILPELPCGVTLRLTRKLLWPRRHISCVRPFWFWLPNAFYSDWHVFFPQYRVWEGSSKGWHCWWRDSIKRRSWPNRDSAAGSVTTSSEQLLWPRHCDFCIIRYSHWLFTNRSCQPKKSNIFCLFFLCKIWDTKALVGGMWEAVYQVLDWTMKCESMNHPSWFFNLSNFKRELCPPPSIYLKKLS